MRTLLTLLCILLTVSVIEAQDVRSWEEYFDRIGQREDLESGSWEEFYDELSELSESKLDLNRCSRDDLGRLPFLSEQQIMDIMEYRDRARRIESPIELRLIPSMERADVDMLLQFVEILPDLRRDTIPSLRQLVRYGRQEAVGMLKIPFYTRKGDRNGYLGYKYKHWLRYVFTSGRRLKAGVVASQDAGEPFFAGRNGMGYDFYSYYLLLRDMGRVKTLALGRYRLRMGMGLILNNSFSLGKLTALSSLGRWSSQVTAHSSRSEGNYLQGAAATVTVAKGLDATAFVSWRKVDATLNADSATVATLLRSGYHRTESEMARRRNTSQLLTGGGISYFNSGFHVGVTALYTRYDRELRPKVSTTYRRWYPAGDRFWNASVDYGYASHRLNLSGETATGTRGSVATVNTVSYQLLSNLSLMALQRYYPYRFCAVFGSAFAEGGAVNNESGVYVGGRWAPIKDLSVTFYMDAAYFAWPKYQAAASSHSVDHLVQADYSGERWKFMARYRLKRRERDNADKTTLIYKNEHRARLSADYDGGRWTMRTQADLSSTAFNRHSSGYMVTQHFNYRHRRMLLRATLGYFHTDDYDSRVYIYEPGMLYQFSFPMFYGEGIRCALVARAEMGRGTTVMGKIGSTRYFDRQTIGSGLQEIASKGITDMEFLVRVKL